MTRAEWINRYNALMENAWTASVIVEPNPEETATAILLADEIRQGLAAGLLSGPRTTPAPTHDDDQLVHASLPLCPRPSAHMPAEHAGQWPGPADERDEPNGEQADPIITQPLPTRFAQRLGDEIRAAAADIANEPNLRTCRCAGCTTARKINARVAERDALT